jgi:hypothetical protein
VHNVLLTITDVAAAGVQCSVLSTNLQIAIVDRRSRVRRPRTGRDADRAKLDIYRTIHAHTKCDE